MLVNQYNVLNYARTLKSLYTRKGLKIIQLTCDIRKPITKNIHLTFSVTTTAAENFHLL